MKFLLVLIIVVLGLWMLLRKRGGRGGADSSKLTRGPQQADRPGTAAMVACAHCDLRLPESEAQFDALGRPFCSEAHRLAGPR